MSGNAKAPKDGPVPVEEAGMTMPPEDMTFLVDCLKNPIGGGVISIDTKAVAEALGYKNAGSVANRIGRLKKRYNLPITSTLSGSRKMDSSSAAEVMVPVTPSKSKVTKTSAPRARAPKTPRKTTHSDSEFGGEGAGKIIAARKKAGKSAATATKKLSGDNDTKGFIKKGAGSSDGEEGEISDDDAKDGEEDDDMEEPEILEVEDGHNQNEI